MTRFELHEVSLMIAREQAVLLYFYSDVCAPCISLRPKVEELIKTHYPKLQIIWIDSPAHPAIAAHFGVFSNPTMLLFFEGREHRRLSKYISLPQLEEAIRRPYEIIFEE